MLKAKWVKMYLDIADRLAEESHATRLKVGAVFISPDGVMSTGINGMPAGGSNECEHKVYLQPSYPPVITEKEINEYYLVDEIGRYKLVTHLELSHAEENLFGKLMRQGVVTKGGTVFLSHEPCINCSKIMVNADIKTVIYRRPYLGSNKTGKEWLRKNNIICECENANL